jgi:probable phosphoglycerate mutase
MAITPLAFWFLRHGETDWNARSLSQGNVDIPLNPRGIGQAEAAAKVLRGRGITTIIHSPLGRARHTAEIVAAELGLPIAADEDLRESAFGSHEGQPMGEWFAEWIEERFTPPGGEPFADLRTRAIGAVNRALGEPPVVLLVGHGAFWRAIRSAIGLEVNVRTPNATPLFVAPPDNGNGAVGWRFEMVMPG